MFSYRSAFLSPQGKTQTPISVGDLPSFGYRVSTQTVTEEVVSFLEAHPDAPGVILLQDGAFHSAIPRAALFERLGHRYGIELFLRKPIIELQQNLGIQTLSISSDLRIKDAALTALRRDGDSMYAPLVVFYNDGETRLLDMYTLLTAQSHILDNANNVFGRMNAIEEALRNNPPFEQLIDLVMDSIMSATPYHRGGIFVSPSRWTNIPAAHPLLYRISDELGQARPFRAIIEQGQPFVIEDLRAHPSRHGLASLGAARAWIGLPVKTIFGVEGVLSLSRHSLTPFTREEVELAKSFADYFGLALNEPPDPRARFVSLEKARRRLGLLTAG